MSDSTPTPDIPKPSIPKPSIPKPNIPKPSIPKPNLDRASSGPPISAVETGAMEAPVQKPAPVPEEEASSIEYSETLLPQRLLAGLIDGVVATALVSILNLPLPDSLSMVSYGFAFGYLLFKDSLPFLEGQSIGKKLMKIQAVTEEGKPLSNDFITGIKRNIFSAILPLALVELYILHSREKTPNAGLRLGDGLAKTKVIAVTPKPSEPIEEVKSPEE